MIYHINEKDCTIIEIIIKINIPLIVKTIVKINEIIYNRDGIILSFVVINFNCLIGPIKKNVDNKQNIFPIV